MDIPNQMAAETYTILADKAFPLVKEVMTPYKGMPNNLTPAQRKFNQHLNSKRHVRFPSFQCVLKKPTKSTFSYLIKSIIYDFLLQTVERAFSLLKRRFRCVRYLNQKSHAKAVTVVMACCILHNIAIMENDNDDYYFSVRGRVQVRKMFH